MWLERVSTLTRPAIGASQAVVAFEGQMTVRQPDRGRARVAQIALNQRLHAGLGTEAHVGAGRLDPREPVVAHEGGDLLLGGGAEGEDTGPGGLVEVRV